MGRQNSYPLLQAYTEPSSSLASIHPPRFSSGPTLFCLYPLQDLCSCRLFFLVNTPDLPQGSFLLLPFLGRNPVPLIHVALVTTENLPACDYLVNTWIFLFYTENSEFVEHLFVKYPVNLLMKVRGGHLWNTPWRIFMKTDNEQGSRRKVLGP